MATANKLMCHVVAGYPSPDGCVQLMLGMQDLGVGVIEVQIPFSDPIADGETIMRANDVALAAKMTTAKSFEMIKNARRKGLKSEIYIMSYLQKVIQCGLEDFCAQAFDAGVKGLIIPDLPYDSEEYENLLAVVKAKSLQIVPVVSPGMNKERLADILSKADGLVYLTSMKGITGKSLSVSKELENVAKKIKTECPGLDLVVGFGVQSAKDVAQILKIADLAVVGSSVIREIEKSDVVGGLKFINKLI